MGRSWAPAALAAARAQELRNWHVTGEALRAADGRVTVRILARDADGIPINDVDFRATLQRPTSRSEDRPVTLAPDLGEAGVYRGTADHVALGQWVLSIEADTEIAAGTQKPASGATTRPHVFKSESRIIFK